MNISRAELQHLATLAGLELGEEVESHFIEDLQSIVSFMEALTEVDTQGVAPLNHPNDASTQPLRTDQACEQSWQTLMAAQAPDYDQGYYLVPQVIDSES